MESRSFHCSQSIKNFSFWILCCFRFLLNLRLVLLCSTPVLYSNLYAQAQSYYEKNEKHWKNLDRSFSFSESNERIFQVLIKHHAPLLFKGLEGLERTEILIWEGKQKFNSRYVSEIFINFRNVWDDVNDRRKDTNLPVIRIFALVGFLTTVTFNVTWSRHCERPHQSCRIILRFFLLSW